MKKCKYTNDYMDYFEALVEASNILMGVEKTCQQLYDKVGEMDRRTGDILHDIELNKFFRTEGHRKARKLKEIRQERRAAKNTIEILTPLREFAKKNKNLARELKAIYKDMENVAESQKNRIYIPRENGMNVIENNGKNNNVVDISKKIA